VETWRRYHSYSHVWDGVGPSRIVFVYITDQQAIQTITAMTNQPEQYFPLGFPDVNNVQVATSATLQIMQGGILGRDPCEGVTLSAPLEVSL
jgi:hypothetical protein